MSRWSLLDLAMVYVGCLLAVGLAVAAVARVVAPLWVSADGGVLVVTAVAAVPVAAWYVWRGFGLGDLGMFVFALVALEFGVGVLAFLVLGALDAAPVTGSPVSRALTAAYACVVYAGAYWLVYRDGWERLTA